MNKKFDMHQDSEPTGKKRFVISGSKPAYKPVEEVIPSYSAYYSTGIESREGIGASRQCHVLIESRASAEIFKHIGWGDLLRNDNRVEQGGLLLGKVYKLADDSFAVVATHAIVGETGRGSAAYLMLDHDTWKRMLSVADVIVEEETSLVVVGWYHTHPNNLDVFFSGTDRATQARMFSQPWHVGIVLNPQNQVWTAFHAEDSKNCGGILFTGEPVADLPIPRDEAASDRDSGTKNQTGKAAPTVSRRVMARWPSIYWAALIVAVASIVCSSILSFYFLQESAKFSERVSGVEELKKMQIGEIEIGKVREGIEGIEKRLTDIENNSKNIKESLDDLSTQARQSTERASKDLGSVSMQTVAIKTQIAKLIEDFTQLKDRLPPPLRPDIETGEGTTPSGNTTVDKKPITDGDDGAETNADSRIDPEPKAENAEVDMPIPDTADGENTKEDLEATGSPPSSSDNTKDDSLQKK